MTNIIHVLSIYTAKHHNYDIFAKVTGYLSIVMFLQSQYLTIFHSENYGDIVICTT